MITFATTHKTITDKLIEIYGFKMGEIWMPSNRWQEFKKNHAKFLLKWLPLKEIKIGNDGDYWNARINDDVYEIVHGVDIWYTRVYKNNEVIFDEKRYHDDDLLSLFPVPDDKKNLYHAWESNIV